MYTTSYKINNSYTTYVIHDYGEDTPISYTYQKPVKQLEWKRGAKVNHAFHGKGVIISIANNHVTVQFKESKVFGRHKSIQVAFEFKNKPNEIDSLRLCY